MPISFQAALRLYAKERGQFILPKKGSSEYDAVKKLQEGTEMGPEHEIKRRSRKGKSATEDQKGAMGGKIVKGVPQGEDSSLGPLPPKSKTSEIDPQEGKKKTKKVVSDTITKPKKEKAVQRDGMTKAAEEVEIMADRNTGPGATVSAQLPGQEAMIKAELKEAKKQVKTKVKENPPEPTIDGMKTDDPKAIAGSAPFSILSLRKKLLA